MTRLLGARRLLTPRVPSLRTEPRVRCKNNGSDNSVIRKAALHASDWNARPSMGAHTRAGLLCEARQHRPWRMAVQRHRSEGCQTLQRAVRDADALFVWMKNAIALAGTDDGGTQTVSKLHHVPAALSRGRAIGSSHALDTGRLGCLSRLLLFTCRATGKPEPERRPGKSQDEDATTTMLRQSARSDGHTTPRSTGAGECPGEPRKCAMREHCRRATASALQRRLVAPSAARRRGALPLSGRGSKTRTGSAHQVLVPRKAEAECERSVRRGARTAAVLCMNLEHGTGTTARSPAVVAWRCDPPPPLPGPRAGAD